MKWDGSLYGAKAAPGSSGLFCAACPQPGINVPTEWKLDPDQLLYSRSFVMDGNFSAVHQRRQNALYEQCLNDGNLFMVAEGAHSIHRAMAREYKDVRHLYEFSSGVLTRLDSRTPVMSIMPLMTSSSSTKGRM